MDTTTVIPRDMRQREFKVGNRVVKAEKIGNTAKLTLRTVEAIENGKVYLDGAYKRGQYLRVPQAVMIIFS